MSSLALAVTLPLLGALLATLWPGRAQPLGLAASLLTALASAWVIAEVWQAGALRLELGGWSAPLGIALVADGFSAAFLGLSALVALGSGLYASTYFSTREMQARFWPLWLLLWAALNALFLAGDFFNLYVTLELLGLTAAALGALGATPEALRANLRYLLIGLLGSLTYLLGVTLIYIAHGTLDLALVGAAITAGPVDATALALMTLGLALKAALFPLHGWLAPAHANAPAPVSAALSALVVKAAFYLIARLWLDVFAPLITPWAASLMGLLGAGAVLWGSWRALRAEQLKVLAAYSTVAQIGALCLFLPLLQGLPAGAAREQLVAALVLMALTHGLAKSGLFLAAGLVQRAAGHDRIAELGGTAQRLPATTFTLGLAGAALIGLPPSGAFIGKWLLIEAALERGQWWWVVVLALGTLLSAAYVFRVLSRAFNQDPTPGRFVSEARTELPALLLALLATAGLGLASAPLWRLLGVAPS
ncbi:MAG: oxidoreductase [Chromatiaceae bacterium]|nr:oxidoreductase [Chromatiaceae bacterium]